MNKHKAYEVTEHTDYLPRMLFWREFILRWRVLQDRGERAPL